nr:hypothetical protein [uncultured bacterium]
MANSFFLKDLYNDFQNLYLHPSGRLAQLVQSTSFTPRGSGVRTPHLPLKRNLSRYELRFRFFFNYVPK